MYLPRANVMTDPDVQRFLEAQPRGHLVTIGPDGRPDATFLPILVGDGRVLGHLARANQQWTRIVDGSPALVIVPGADAYVSPSWYASKQEHGRVVPTWNYSEVQVRGEVSVHDDPEWVLDIVTRLTHRHELGREEPWAVTDAPAKYVRGSLRAIVGVEVIIEQVEGKAKLSQNRSRRDREGVLNGLRDEPAPAASEVARAMASAEPVALPPRLPRV